MKKNIGQNDRIIRLIAAIIFSILGFTVNPWFYLLAAILLFTAAVGWCGLYTILGINTCKTPPPTTSNKPTNN